MDPAQVPKTGAAAVKIIKGLPTGSLQLAGRLQPGPETQGFFDTQASGLGMYQKDCTPNLDQILVKKAPGKHIIPNESPALSENNLAVEVIELWQTPSVMLAKTL